MTSTGNFWDEALLANGSKDSSALLANGSKDSSALVATPALVESGIADFPAFWDQLMILPHRESWNLPLLAIGLPEIECSAGPKGGSPMLRSIVFSWAFFRQGATKAHTGKENPYYASYLPLFTRLVELTSQTRVSTLLFRDVVTNETVLITFFGNSFQVIAPELDCSYSPAQKEKRQQQVTALLRTNRVDPRTRLLRVHLISQ